MYFEEESYQYPVASSRIEIEFISQRDTMMEIYWMQSTLNLFLKGFSLQQAVECDTQDELIPVDLTFTIENCEDACTDCDRFESKCYSCEESLSFLNEYGACVCRIDNVLS